MTAGVSPMGGEDENGPEMERLALERASMNGEVPAAFEPSRAPSREVDPAGQGGRSLEPRPPAVGPSEAASGEFDPETSGKAEAAGESLARIRVLLIEDDQWLATLMRRLLERT